MNNLRRVILLRHCQSIANGGQATTLDSIALSDSGFKDAEEIARGMHEPPDVLVSSPMLRALQTIKPISTRFSLPYEIVGPAKFKFKQARWNESRVNPLFCSGLWGILTRIPAVPAVNRLRCAPRFRHNKKPVRPRRTTARINQRRL